MKPGKAEPRAGVLSEWIGRVELAEELGVAPDTLARWATRGTGPPLVRVGRRVFYRRKSVERWLAESERKNRNE